MYFVFGLLAIAAGCLNAIQAGANATLNKTLGQPILAALIISAAAIIVYLITAIFTGLGWPAMSRFQQVPWWAWIGGVLGAGYVLSTIFLAEKLGAAVFTGLTVTAAILTSVAIDHFGLIGFDQHSINLWRVIGCGLMIAGLTLVCAF